MSFISIMMAGREIALLTFVPDHFQLPSVSQIAEELSRLKQRNADLTMKLEQVRFCQIINTKCDKLMFQQHILFGSHVVHFQFVIPINATFWFFLMYFLFLFTGC